MNKEANKQAVAVYSPETMRKKVISPLLPLILLVMLCLMPVAASADSWPMFMKDQSHSSYAERAPRPPLQLKWSFKTEGPLYSSPVFSDNKVYIGSSDSYLYAIDAEYGRTDLALQDRWDDNFDTRDIQ